jgi:hypothetical protein
VLQKENVAMAFGTPISTYLWPDSDALNAEFRQVILAKEKADKGIKRSNVGGWHSAPDLFVWEAACARELKDRVAALALDLTRLLTGQAVRERSIFKWKAGRTSRDAVTTTAYTITQVRLGLVFITYLVASPTPTIHATASSN